MTDSCPTVVLSGFEVAGVIHDVCNTIPNSNFIPGAKVILFPDEELANSGYMEYIRIQDVENVVQVPQNMPLEVAAMLPGGALSAYSALLKAKPHVEKLQDVKCKYTIPNIIICTGKIQLTCDHVELSRILELPKCFMNVCFLLAL